MNGSCWQKSTASAAVIGNLLLILKNLSATVSLYIAELFRGMIKLPEASI